MPKLMLIGKHLFLSIKIIPIVFISIISLETRSQKSQKTWEGLKIDLIVLKPIKKIETSLKASLVTLWNIFPRKTLVFCAKEDS